MYGITKIIKIDWEKYLEETRNTQEYLNNLVEYFHSNEISEVIFFNLGSFSKFNLLIYNLKSLTEKGNVYIEQDSVKFRPSGESLSFKTTGIIKIDWVKCLKTIGDAQEYLNSIIDYSRSDENNGVVFFNIGSFSDFNSLISNLKSSLKTGSVYVDQDAVKYKPSDEPLSFNSWFETYYLRS